MAEVPYRCAKCGVSGVKLWRPYQPFHGFDLLCADDACAVELEDPVSVLATSDQIGWHVPAVPVDGEPGSFWGYTSVPQDRLEWWHSLPLRSPGEGAKP